MTITTEKAMQDLERLKEKYVDSYWHGVFIGSAGAYMRANIITVEQYRHLTDPEFASAENKDQAAGRAL